MNPIFILIGAALMATTSLGAEPPGILTYQGRVNVDGSPYSGTGFFKFALVNAVGSTTHWSNDGTSANGAEPAAAISIAISNGLFTVPLGDITIPNMTASIPANVFANNGDVRLRIWFNDGVNGSQQLLPDQRLTSAPYALHAAGAENVAIGAVTTGGIADGTITEADIAPGAINSLDAADGSPTSVVFVDNDGGVGVSTGSPHANARLTVNANGRFQAIRASSGAASHPTIYGFNGNVLGSVIHADGIGDVEPEGGGIIIIGQENSYNLALDRNEIMARSNGVPSQLLLNFDGGNTQTGGRLGVGVDPGFAQLRVKDTDSGAAFGLEVETTQQSSLPSIYAHNEAGGPALWARSDGNDISLAGGGIIMTGIENGQNLAIDTNEIMARNNGQPSSLNLNAEGGDVLMGANAIKPAFAYGKVAANGTIISQSVNVTSVSHPSEGVYRVNVVNGAQAADIILVTARFGFSAGGVESGAFEVQTGDASGSFGDREFNFIVYRP